MDYFDKSAVLRPKSTFSLLTSFRSSLTYLTHITGQRTPSRERESRMPRTERASQSAPSRVEAERGVGTEASDRTTARTIFSIPMHTRAHESFLAIFWHDLRAISILNGFKRWICTFLTKVCLELDILSTDWPRVYISQLCFVTLLESLITSHYHFTAKHIVNTTISMQLTSHFVW